MTEPVDQAKQALFTRFRSQLPQAIELHRQFRLFELDAQGRSWENVSEHCLIEAARTEVLAEWLNFAIDLKNDLVLAAALHDFNKRFEIEAIDGDIAAGGSGWAGYDRASETATQELKRHGFTERVIRLANSAGGRTENLFAIDVILNRTQPIEDDIACLVMYYVDSYTRGSDWVESAAEDNGQLVNDVDRRLHKIYTRPDYHRMNNASISLFKDHPRFAGKTTAEVMLELSHQVEMKLSELMKQQSHQLIKPRRLPELIDETVRASLSTSLRTSFETN